jgi:Protein of unknown function (DUF3540)
MNATVSSRRKKTDVRQLSSSHALPQAMQAMAAIDGQWCVGIVQQIKDASGDWCITSGGLQASAKVAASCLLQPSAGDSVACLKVAPAQVWIMSILSREEGVMNVLHCKGETRLQVTQGSLDIQAQTLSMQSQHLQVAAQSAEVVMESAHIAGKQFKLTAGLIKVIGSTLSTVMERIQQYSKNYTRHTDGSDLVNAKHMQMQARQLMQLDAEHTLISGERLVKARSAQIHFG